MQNETPNPWSTVIWLTAVAPNRNTRASSMAAAPRDLIHRHSTRFCCRRAGPPSPSHSLLSSSRTWRRATSSMTAESATVCAASSTVVPAPPPRPHRPLVNGHSPSSSCTGASSMRHNAAVRPQWRSQTQAAAATE